MSGAVEALEDSLLRIDVGDEVALRIIHRGVGAITQNDVNLATVDNAVIIGFNVRPAERVAEMADAEGVEIKYYNVIYSAIDDIEAALKGMLKPIYEEVQLGTAEIRQVFRSGKFGNIAGSIVRSGTIKRGTKLAWCATVWLWPTTSRSPLCVAKRTTSPRSARATSAVSRWVTRTSPRRHH